MQDSLQLAEI